MTNIVLQLAPDLQQQVHAHYANSRVERNAPGVVFAAKLSDTAITSYKSGKVMFQGGGAEREAARWGTAHPVTSKASATKGDVLPENLAQLSIIGSDETGTGDYFGPITVAAVYIPADKIALIEALGVKDSKALNDIFIREVAPTLMKACTYSVKVINNDKYNDIQARGYSQGKIKALLHNTALNEVLEKIAPAKPDYILIDQFAERNVYYNYLKGRKDIVQENVLFSTKAEGLHVAVATASIIARYKFLLRMDSLSQDIGFTLQKGASKLVDEMAARILLKHGEEKLQSITKWHFANTNKARSLAAKKRK